MFYPHVHERVRVSHRADEYIVLCVDHAARTADLCILTDATTIESGVPFELLSAPGEYLRTRDGLCRWDDWLAANRFLLSTAHAQMHQTILLIAEFQNSLLKTMEVIRTSRERIEFSDLVIARAQTLGCEETGTGAGRRLAARTEPSNLLPA